MTVTRRGYSVTMNTPGTSASSVIVSVPADTMDGDLMIVVSTNSAAGATAPAGWDLVGYTDSSTLHQSAMWKRIASSEPASYTWNFGTSSTCGVAMIVFVGAHDILSYDMYEHTATATPYSRRMDTARDAVCYSVCAWRDAATNTFTSNQGADEFDEVSSNTGATIYRGITAAYYGPGVGGITDIINIGDSLPNTTFTGTTTIDNAIVWAILIDNKAPDAETWSSTNGDFAVDLKLDSITTNSVGGLTSPLRGDITGQVSAFTESAENAPDETTEMLADGLSTTKWLTFADSGWVQYDFGASVTKTVRRYRLTSANDVPDRDPYNWTLKGSNNGTDFTVLDTRTAEAFGNRGEVREFKLNGTPGAYRYYRLDITSNRGPSATIATQLAEFRLSEIDVWEDITTKVVEESKIRITRGLQSTSGRSDFSRAYVELNNTDGRFSLQNPDGLYYGALQRNNEMRISKAFGTKSLQLQGAVRVEGTNMCGDGVRTVLTEDLTIVGDIDVRIDFEPDSWRDEQMLCGVQTQTSDTVDPTASWTLHMDDDGRLVWTHETAAGATETYTSTLALPQANRQAVKVTLDVDNGASGSTATFYYSDSISGSWTQLGDAVTNTGVTDIVYWGGALCVGHVGSKDYRGIHGMVYHFELRTGIAGTLVSDVDFTALTNGVHEFEENGNRWVTVNNAVVSNRRYRFHGEVAEWPLMWDATGTWITASATGAGIQKRLERGTSPKSAMGRYHTHALITDPGAFEQHATPYAYWSMEDHEDTFMIASDLPSKPGMQIYGTPLFDEQDGQDLLGSGNLIKLNGAKFGGRVTGNEVGYADIRWMMYAPTTLTANTNFLTIYGTGLLRKWTLSYTATDTWRLRGFDEDDTGSPIWDSGAQTISTLGEPMHCQLTLDYTGGLNVDVTVRTYDTYGISLGTFTNTFLLASIGRIYRINVNDGDTVQASNLYIGHLALYGADSPTFAGPEIDAHHYETAARRIKRICDEEGIQFRYSGALGDSAFMGYQDIDAPFSIMSSAAVSDDGYLVDPLDAFGIEYRTSRSIMNRSAHLTLSYTSGELSDELQPVSDDSYIVNDFVASRGGAGSARYQLTEGALSVNAPPDGVGSYEDEQSYSLAHEGQCVDIASWAVHRGTLDEMRFRRMTLALENLRIAADTALTERILLLDVGHRVDITDTPSFLPPEDIRQTITGYEEWFDNFQHNIALTTVPERSFEVAEYDSDYRFAQHTSTLYQDISASATSINVVNETGLQWSETATDFDAVIDGERITVTAVANASTEYSTDSFTRADSTTNLGSTDGGTVTAWTQQSGTWGINTNAAYISAGGDSIATITSSADFEEVSVTATTLAAATEFNVVFRFSDTSNYWRWGGTEGLDAVLEKVVAGSVTTYTPDASGSDFVIAQGDEVSVRCHGSVIEVMLNGQLALTISDTFNSTATEVGMRTLTTTTRFDDFTWISSDPIQALAVTRGVGASTGKAHKAGAAVKLYQTPYRGL